MAEVLKLVLVGQNGGGKTTMLVTYTSGTFPGWVPSVFDNYSLNMTVDDHKVTLTLWDTGDCEDYERLRRLSYPQTDIFLVCFSVVSRESFNYCRTFISPELMKHCPKAPVILLGMKTDLRTDPDTICRLEKKGERPITEKEGDDLCRELGYVKYMECSSKNKEGLDEVFNEAVRVALDPEKYINDNWRRDKNGRDCVLM